MAERCRNCGDHIVLVNFAMGEKWMHQPEGAAFSDGTHEYCFVTRAEPAALAEKGADS